MQINFKVSRKQFNFKHIFYTNEQGQIEEFKTTVED